MQENIVLSEQLKLIPLYIVVSEKAGFKKLEEQFMQHIDPQFCEYLGLNIQKTEVGYLNFVDKLLHSSHIYWCVYYENICIGLLYIYDYKQKYFRCNIALGLISQYRNRGLGKDLIEGFTEYLIKDLDFVRVGVEIEDTNEASLRLIQKIECFKYEGKLLNNYGKGIHSNVYARVV